MLLSHYTPWGKNQKCSKVLFDLAGAWKRVKYNSNDDPTEWELLASAQKRMQPSHSHKHIFRTKHPHEPRIGYLWSVGPLLFCYIFISSVRIIVGLRGIFERRWIHQPLKTWGSDNWLKWAQMFIGYANMMLELFVVIRSIRTCKFVFFRKNIGNTNALSNDKTRVSTWLMLAHYLQKKQTNSHLF